MKKILLLSLLSLIAVVQVSAQRHNHRKGDIKIEDVEYKSVVLSYPETKELLMFIPVDLTIVDGEEGRIEISYPVQEEEYINYGFRDGRKFIIGRDGNKKTPKNTILCDKIPVRMTVSLSDLCRIFSNSNVDIFIGHDSFNNSLYIQNGLAMSINAKSITAAESIKILNSGTFTCKVQQLNTPKLEVVTNDGFTGMWCSTNAKHVSYKSNGIDNISMGVACEDLQIFSRSKGVICFTGTTDQVSLISRRKSTATIALPELNQ